jgi:hypothetical protein
MCFRLLSYFKTKRVEPKIELQLKNGHLFVYYTIFWLIKSIAYEQTMLGNISSVGNHF